jgi:hypothetical protein
LQKREEALRRAEMPDAAISAGHLALMAGVAGREHLADGTFVLTVDR